MIRCVTSEYAECDSETDDPSRDNWCPLGWGLGPAPEKWPTDWRCNRCMQKLHDSMVAYLKANIK